MLICLLLFTAAVSSTVLSDQIQAEYGRMPEGFQDLFRRESSAFLAPSQGYSSRMLRQLRSGGDFDPLLGRSFGVSKRDWKSYRSPYDNYPARVSAGKRNFDEIDNAGFSDYLRKRQPLEAHSAWDGYFRNGKRNFDEIDNAGFKDYLYKRDSVDIPWYVHRPGKRNFDEIDNAGFKDYLYKRQPPEMNSLWYMTSRPRRRNFDEMDNAGFKDYLLHPPVNSNTTTSGRGHGSGF